MHSPLLDFSPQLLGYNPPPVISNSAKWQFLEKPFAAISKDIMDGCFLEKQCFWRFVPYIPAFPQGLHGSGPFLYR